MRMAQFARKQRVTIISGIASFHMIIVLLQLWFFTTTMETFLAGYQETVFPAALASVVCFALNGGLSRVANMRSVQTVGSTHAHRARISPPC